MDKSILKVDWATHAAAKHACERWHYSKSVPVPPLFKVGAWENGAFFGVVIFSRGATPNLLNPYGIKQDEGCELTRIALTQHLAPVSRIVRLALLFLKRTNPKMRLIVSFADPQYSHHGGIYQAGNWIYAGRTAAGREYWKNGKRLHGRQVSEKGCKIQQGKMRRAVRPSECVIKKTEGKHRYLMPLDAEMRARVAHLAQPYPKRPKKHEAGDQPEVGGAVPTRTLQTSQAEEVNG